LNSVIQLFFRRSYFFITFDRVIKKGQLLPSVTVINRDESQILVIKRGKIFWQAGAHSRPIFLGVSPQEINTFSSVLRSVDHWAAASVCNKDVIHSDYCASELSVEVSFKNKLWTHYAFSCLKSRSLVNVIRSLYNLCKPQTYN